MTRFISRTTHISSKNETFLEKIINNYVICILFIVFNFIILLDITKTCVMNTLVGHLKCWSLLRSQYWFTTFLCIVVNEENGVNPTKKTAESSSCGDSVESEQKPGLYFSMNNNVNPFY